MDTYNEIVVEAEYSEARMHYNNDLHGRPEPREDEELVPQSCACPRCGEQRMDMLMLDDDDIVTCASCGEVYDISPEAQLARVTLEDLSEPLIDRYALAHPGALM